jgi:hypothetical protein
VAVLQHLDGLVRVARLEDLKAGLCEHVGGISTQEDVVFNDQDEWCECGTHRDMPGSMDAVMLAHTIAKKCPPVRLLVMSGSRLELAALSEGAQLCPKPCPLGRMTSIVADPLTQMGPNQRLH